MGVKLVVQVKLLPDAATDAALRETLNLCNRAANYVSRRAFDTNIKGKTSLQRLVYGDLKEMGLSAQPAIHAARKVAGAYATVKANLKAGNYGPQGSKRRAKVENSPVRFRKDAAQPFDDRCLSWQPDALTVSIWTVRGRSGRSRSPAPRHSLTCCAGIGGASPTWYSGAGPGTCTPPARFPNPKPSTRTGSSAWTWVSRTSPPPPMASATRAGS
ncbi:hypothetical protein GCM10011574_44320 [Microbispora bryophytorum]|uniref:Transposase n=1 Tax=Microbispora bryophytorum TaxID=1460882 RepID=A0A8H9H1Q4_9ACTN|nr:hypothetical protein GCM10011574_44320 [Microbispora bryophytorum]